MLWSSYLTDGNELVLPTVTYCKTAEMTAAQGEQSRHTHPMVKCLLSHLLISLLESKKGDNKSNSLRSRLPTLTKPPAIKAPAHSKSPPSDGGSDLIQLVSDNLRLLRTARRMTQRDLAAAAGISQKHVSEIELAGSNLTLDVLARLCRCLEITPAEMLTPLNFPGRR
jgi:DNA-binding Xre family transcriptional regulator